MLSFSVHKVMFSVLCHPCCLVVCIMKLNFASIYRWRFKGKLDPTLKDLMTHHHIIHLINPLSHNPHDVPLRNSPLFKIDLFHGLKN